MSNTWFLGVDEEIKPGRSSSDDGIGNYIIHTASILLIYNSTSRGPQDLREDTEFNILIILHIFTCILWCWLLVECKNVEAREDLR